MEKTVGRPAALLIAGLMFAMGCGANDAADEGVAPLPSIEDVSAETHTVPALPKDAAMPDSRPSNDR